MCNFFYIDFLFYLNMTLKGIESDTNIKSNSSVNNCNFEEKPNRNGGDISPVSGLSMDSSHDSGSGINFTKKKF